MKAIAIRSSSPLLGFGLSFGIMMTLLSIIVLLPLAALLGRGLTIGPMELWGMINSRRVWGALALSFRSALIASLFNLVLGLLLAWVLVRCHFCGRKFLDAAIIALLWSMKREGWNRGPRTLIKPFGYAKTAAAR